MASSTEDAPKTDGKATTKKSLSREEHRALLNHHVGKLRLAKVEVDKAREPLASAQEAFTAMVNEAKADLGKAYTRKRLTSLLEDITSRLRDLDQEERGRFQDRVDLGLPVYGVQQDMFGGAADSMPQEAKDEAFWFAEGALVGRRAGERKGPEGCPPRMDQHFLRGYDAGQAEVGRLFVEAVEVKKRLAEPAADQQPVDLNAAPEPTVHEEKAAERKSVARAKASLAAMGATANEVAA